MIKEFTLGRYTINFWLFFESFKFWLSPRIRRVQGGVQFSLETPIAYIVLSVIKDKYL